MSARELRLRGEGHVEQHLRRHNHHVWRHAVARHAVFAFFDCLVEAQLLLLRDAVHHDLVVHRGADVPLGTQVLRAIVVEVVCHGKHMLEERWLASRIWEGGVQFPQVR